MRKKKTSSHRIQGQNLNVYDGIEAALSQLVILFYKSPFDILRGGCKLFHHESDKVELDLGLGIR